MLIPWPFLLIPSDSRDSHQNGDTKGQLDRGPALGPAIVALDGVGQPESRGRNDPGGVVVTIWT